MARPEKPRWIDSGPGYVFFVPRNSLHEGEVPVVMSLDELEAIRLADRDGLSQEEAAVLMNVSRATFGRIVARGRGKTALALTQGRPIHIDGGAVKFPPPGGHRRHGGGHGGGQGPGGGGGWRGGRGPHGGE